MTKPRTDARAAIRDVLVADGYTIISSESDVSDPFAWSTTARKGDYEITVKERSVVR